MFPLYLATETILPVLSWVKTADTDEAEEELCCIVFFYLKYLSLAWKVVLMSPPAPCPGCVCRLNEI